MTAFLVEPYCLSNAFGEFLLFYNTFFIDPYVVLNVFFTGMGPSKKRSAKVGLRTSFFMSLRE